MLKHFGVQLSDLESTDVYFKTLLDDASIDAAIVTAGIEHPDLHQVLSTNRFEPHKLPDGRSIPGTFAEPEELVQISNEVGARQGLMQAVGADFDVLRAVPDDLVMRPVPIVVDTQALIASGEVNPDGSNIRFRNAAGTVELDYWIESGLNSCSTLIWIRHKAGESPNGDQLYLAVEDPSVLGLVPVWSRASVLSPETTACQVALPRPSEPAAARACTKLS